MDNLNYINEYRIKHHWCAWISMMHTPLTSMNEYDTHIIDMHEWVWYTHYRYATVSMIHTSLIYIIESVTHINDIHEWVWYTQHWYQHWYTWMYD
jgi:hypothetical protein